MTELSANKTINEDPAVRVLVLDTNLDIRTDTDLSRGEALESTSRECQITNVARQQLELQMLLRAMATCELDNQ